MTALLHLCTSASHEVILIRIANRLRNLLQQFNVELPILYAASTTLGQLARLSSPLTVDLVSFQLTAAFEWLHHHTESSLSSASETRLLAAVLILKEFASSVPTLFNTRVPLFLDSIWIAIRHPRSDIREVATLALRVCLADIATRADRWKKQCWLRVFTAIQFGLQTRHRRQSTADGSTTSPSKSASPPPHTNSLATSSGSVAAPSIPMIMQARPHESQVESSARIHGAVLSLGELLDHASAEWLGPRFEEIMRLILQYRQHSSPLVRRTVLTILPRAVRLQPEECCAPQLLDTLLLYIEEHIATEQHRDTAFLALGRLSASLGQALVPRLPALFGSLASSLSLTIGVLPDTAPTPAPTKLGMGSFFGFGKAAAPDAASINAQNEVKRRQLCFTHTALASIGMLAASLQESIASPLMPLLDLMLQTGLSQHLVDCLTSIATHIPSLRSRVQDRLLEMIATMLQHATQPSGGDSRVSSMASSNTISPTSGAPSHRPTKAPYQAPLTQLHLALLPNGRVPMELLPPSSRLTAIRTPAEVREHDTSAILLALRTLASFDFITSQEAMLLVVTMEILSLMLDDQQVELRQEAARTVTVLIPRLAVAFHNVALSSLFDLLKRLLVMAISDSSAHIRFAILSSFLTQPTASSSQLVLVSSEADADADTTALHRRMLEQEAMFSLLAQPEALASLSFCLNEEVFIIRERALALFASLAPRNATVVLPTLRTFLMQLLCALHHHSVDSPIAEVHAHDTDALLATDIIAIDLDLSVSPPLAEQHTKLLLTLISYPGGEKLCRHYASAILHVLLPKLTHLLSLHTYKGVHTDSSASVVRASNSSTLVASMLSTLGKLSMLAGNEMRSSINLLLQLIVTTLQDHASTMQVEDRDLLMRRTVAVRTLGQLIASTGAVIEPYLAYPQLLPTLLTLVRSDATRLELLAGQRRSDLIDGEDARGMPNVPLSSMLGQTSQREFRLELLKLLGKIGTLNPYRFKHSPMLSLRAHTEAFKSNSAIDDSSVPARFLSTEPLLSDLLAESSADPDTPNDPKTVMYERYFPTIVLRALMHILVNSRLAPYHAYALRALLFNLRSLGATKSAHFLPSIMPLILTEMCKLALPQSTLAGPVPVLSLRHEVIGNSTHSPHVGGVVAPSTGSMAQLQLNYVHHLIGVTHIVGGIFIRPYLAGVFFLLFGPSFSSAASAGLPAEFDTTPLVPYWYEPALTPALLKLIEVIACASGSDEEFTLALLPITMRSILDLIERTEERLTREWHLLTSDESSGQALLIRVLHTLQALSNNVSTLADFLPLLMPALLRILDQSVLAIKAAPPPPRNPISVRVPTNNSTPAFQLAVTIVRTLVVLLRRHQGGPYTSRLVHAVARIMQSPTVGPSALTEACFELLSTLVIQLGFEFLVYFESGLHRQMQRIVHAYDTLDFGAHRPERSPSTNATPASNRVMRVSSMPSLQDVAEAKPSPQLPSPDGRLFTEASDGSTRSEATAAGLRRSPSTRVLQGGTRHQLGQFQYLVDLLKSTVDERYRESRHPLWPTVDSTVDSASASPAPSTGSTIRDLRIQDLFHMPLFASCDPLHPATISNASSESDLESLAGGASHNSSYVDLAAMEAQLDMAPIGDLHSLQPPPAAAPESTSAPKKFDMSPANLARAWTATQRSRPDDWREWMRGFSIELLKESPSPSLRACSFLAQKYPALSHSLFHAAFLACWTELDAAYKDDIIENLEFIFAKCTATMQTQPPSGTVVLHQLDHSSESHHATIAASSIPSSIVTSLLNLVEFMAHSEQTLPISAPLLSALAEHCHAFATALHYIEAEFQQSMSDQHQADPLTPPDLATSVEPLSTNDSMDATIAVTPPREHLIESLITINNKLNQKAAADGILKLVAQQQLEAHELSLRRLNQTAREDQRAAAMERGEVFAPGFGPLVPSTPAQVSLQPLWFEKLHRWQDALDVYERRQEEMLTQLTAELMTQQSNTEEAASLTLAQALETPQFVGRNELVEMLIGKMRCLRSLGEWDRLASLAQSVWNTTEDPAVRRDVCCLAATAACNLRRWESMAPMLVYFDADADFASARLHTRAISSSQTRHQFDSNYYAAIFLIHRNRFEEARLYINRATELLDLSLSALLNESYARAYKPLLLVQRLVQLEESIEYKMEGVGSAVAMSTTAGATNGLTARQRIIQQMWLHRIQGGLSLEGEDDIIDGWNEQLALQQLVNTSNTFTNEINLDAYLQFCEILRKQSQDHSGATPFLFPLVAFSPAALAQRLNSPYLRRSEAILRNVIGFDPTELIRDLLPPTPSSALTAPPTMTSAQHIAHLFETIRPRHRIPNLLFVLWKFLYACGYRNEARSKLHEMLRLTGIETDVFTRLARQAAIEINSGVTSAEATELRDLQKLKAICYVKLGKWSYSHLESTVGSGGPDSDPPLPTRSAHSPFTSRSSSAILTEPPLLRAISADLPSSSSVSGSVATSSAHSLGEILNFYAQATQADPKFGKAWHEWAMLNVRICTTWKSIIRAAAEAAATNSNVLTSPLSPDSRSSSVTSNATVATFLPYIVAAIRGFFRNISLQPVGDAQLADLLRTLSLWFENGDSEAEEELPLSDAAMHPSHAEEDTLPMSLPSPIPESGSLSIARAMRQGFHLIPLESLLGVVPQLLARIHITTPSVRSLLFDLLVRMGRAHPQALVYPLTVASKSPLQTRQQTACAVLDSIASHSRNLVTQASMVASELVRVSILWHEQWHEGIEEASKAWFGNNDLAGMRRILEPLHASLAHAQTMAETQFVATYGRELDEAFTLLQRAAQGSIGAPHRSLRAPSSDEPAKPSSTLMRKVWETYTGIWHRLTAHIASTHELELSDCSPKLLLSRDLELAVPGTYRAGQPVIHTSSFASLLRVIDSKQHPRRLTILGSDGIEYPFLLKGHEDLRQDERVMQLFGLLNTLFSADHATSKADLTIRRYEVVPLSPNSGLIEWVANSDPLHAIIKRYRDHKRILINVEQRLMLKAAPDYHLCTGIQKLDVFEHACRMTSGADLANVMYLNALNSQSWIDRRECFTRTTAVMSMVGYILGLGDRHASNILISASSAGVCHIDFGDLFEVAMHRDKFPERVPFRLTRMIVNAFEVAGIDGTFRQTCEQAMRVIRKNKNSVLAVLEAFSLDPLLNWRLLDLRRKPHASRSAAVTPTNNLQANLPPPPVLMAPSSADEGLEPPRHTDIARIIADQHLINHAPKDASSAASSSHAATHHTLDHLANVSPHALASHPQPTGAARAKSEASAASTGGVNIPTGGGGGSSLPARPSLSAVREEAVEVDATSALPPSPAHLRRSVVDESSLITGATIAQSTAVSTAPANGTSAAPTRLEQLNAEALAVIKRVEAKLRGVEFQDSAAADRMRATSSLQASAAAGAPAASMSVPSQVQRLIEEATSNFNLAQLYIGWCPFW